MRDYAELVKALRHCIITIPCDGCPYYSHGDKPSKECSTMNFAAADAIEELLDELTTIRKQLPHWISVEERLPEDFQKVLVFWWEHGEPMIDAAFWQKDAKRFDGEHWVRMEDKVTHWMPLPAPPKGVE